MLCCKMAGRLPRWFPTLRDPIPPVPVTITAVTPATLPLPAPAPAVVCSSVSFPVPASTAASASVRVLLSIPARTYPYRCKRNSPHSTECRMHLTSAEQCWVSVLHCGCRSTMTDAFIRQQSSGKPLPYICIPQHGPDADSLSSQACDIWSPVPVPVPVPAVAAASRALALGLA